MIPIPSDIVEALIIEYTTDIKSYVSELKANLADVKGLTSVQKRYVQKLRELGREIITADYNRIQTLAKQFDQILKLNEKNEADLKFKEKILKALGYTKRRSDFYPGYFQKLGIKACVYCNSQLCITVENDKKDLVGRFQVDHFIPKDRYPCFSIALYNLYPVCASCNNKKGVKRIQFELYQKSKKINDSDFKFALAEKNKTVANYLATRNPKTIKILFHEPDVKYGYKKFDELFSVKGIYDTQIDIVEELILKSHIYDKSFRKTLQDSFKKLFPKDDSTLNRLIIGTYVDKQEIHKRPLSKFIQDIAKQLDLI